MPTLTTTDPKIATRISNGPSRMDLLLSLFDREHAQPLRFYIEAPSARVSYVFVWLNGLSKVGTSAWRFEGTITNDSRVAANQAVSGVFADDTRLGYFEQKLG